MQRFLANSVGSEPAKPPKPPDQPAPRRSRPSPYGLLADVADDDVEAKVRSLLAGHLDATVVRGHLLTLLKARSGAKLRELAAALGAAELLEIQIVAYDRSALRESLIERLLLEYAARAR